MSEEFVEVRGLMNGFATKGDIEEIKEALDLRTMKEEFDDLYNFVQDGTFKTDDHELFQDEMEFKFEEVRKGLKEQKKVVDLETDAKIADVKNNIEFFQT
jgi:hypothetical protein